MSSLDVIVSHGTCVRQVCTVRSVQILSGKEQCGVELAGELAGHLSSCCISVHMYNPAFLRALVMALVSYKALKLYHRFRASTGGRVYYQPTSSQLYIVIIDTQDNTDPLARGPCPHRYNTVPQPYSQTKFHSHFTSPRPATALH